MLYKSLIAFLIFFCPFVSSAERPIVISSKKFTENLIVAEIFAQILEANEVPVERRFGMGGTMMAYSALETKEIDLYPEYTGTVAITILGNEEKDFTKINNSIKKMGIEMLKPLGFDNSYSLVMNRKDSEKLKINKISDLKTHPELRGAVSFEFQERPDGWAAMKKVYHLPQVPQGIEIPLTYEALKNRKVDFVEAYTTEPLIQKYDFVILDDDLHFFPKYNAVPLVRSDCPLKVKEVLNQLANTIDNESMMRLNGQAVNGLPIPQVANDFLVGKGLVSQTHSKQFNRGIQWDKMWTRTQTHIYLTLLAVFFAIIVAVPLATFIAPYKKLAQPILGAASVMQTIPSIALLTFMIPFFGIGFLPAIVGLFIYSLLPILQNTYVAMINIDPRIITAARGIGLYPMEVLVSVKLPLAFPTILAGIRTATILNIGTATLAAFIGAGGLGEPIVSGLALNNNFLVLQGAIPAACLAIVMDAIFALVNRFFVKNI